jgi:hypothetical protein
MIGIAAPPPAQGFAASDSLGSHALNKAMEYINNPGNNNDHHTASALRDETVETAGRSQDYRVALMDFASLPTTFDSVKNLDAVMQESAGAIVNLWA